MRRVLFGVAASFLVIWAQAPLVAAAGSGLAVTPAIVQLSASPSSNSLSFKVSLINNYPQPVTVAVRTTNFTALGNNGNVAFLNATTSTGHGLADSLTPALKLLPLGAHQSAVDTISVSNLAKLAPGGHYGAVIFSLLGGSSTGPNRLTNQPALSTLVFVSTASGATKRITLAPPKIGGLLTSLPTSLNLVVTNSGNTQVTPKGIVRLLNGQETVAQGVINSDSGLVLPATNRLYEVNLRYLKEAPSYGRYSLAIAYQADSGQPTTVWTRHFWYISLILIILLVIVLAVVLGWVMRQLRRRFRQALKR